MKKLICIMLTMLIVLNGCDKKFITQNNSSNELEQKNEIIIDDSLVKLQEDIKKNNAVGGIIFLGYYDTDNFEQAIDTEYSSKYPFLKNIADDNCIKNDGNEFYCFIPADVKYNITVHQWIIDENKGYIERCGDILYQSKTGKPILFRGNESDIIPNLIITVTDSSGNEVLKYNPFISLKDDTVAIPLGNKEEPLLIDYTFYE